MSKLRDRMKGVIEHLKAIFGAKIDPVTETPVEEGKNPYDDIPGVGWTDDKPHKTTVGQITFYGPYTPKSSTSSTTPSVSKEPPKMVKKRFNADDYAWHSYVSVVDFVDEKGKPDPTKLVLRTNRKFKGADDRLEKFLKDMKLKPVGEIKKGKDHYVAVVRTKEFDAASIEVEVPETSLSKSYDTKTQYGPKEKWTSAGGVVIPSLDDMDHVYVVKPTNNFGPWAFPKGKVEKGETLAKAGMREVEEETGIVAKILPGGYLGAGAGGYSISHFFVMVQTGGDTAKHDKEMEEIRLCTWEEALKLFAGSGNSRDVKIAMKAWEFVRRIKKRKELEAAKATKG